MKELLYCLKACQDDLILSKIIYSLPYNLYYYTSYRHVIFAPSAVNLYVGASFPGVTDALLNATSVKDWEFVHHQLDVVAIHVRYSTQIMDQIGTEWVKN